MPISISALNERTNTALDFYTRTQPVGQNVANKPLLQHLEAGKKEFPGGQGYVSGPVQGNWASDTDGFFGWYSDSDQVSFVHPDDIQQAKYIWREWHCGIVLSYSDLKRNGVSVDTSGKPVNTPDREIQIVDDWLEAKVTNDFGESMSRSLNDALWRDGSQSAKAVVGILGLLDDDPSDGTVGNIDRGDYDWWRHRVNLAAPWSPDNLSLLNFLDDEMLQLMKFGGQPDVALCGSDFLGALRREIRKSGGVQNANWNSKTATQIKMADVVYGNMLFQYDPELDKKGKDKRCYLLDSRHIKLMPMKGSWAQVHQATRPYDQFVLFKSVTGTCTISVDQFNCHGVYSIV